MAKNFRKLGELEICPSCKSILIQYDERRDQCYCLECNNRWEEDIDFHNIDSIKNDHLRISIRRIVA